jgi:hypothetical protein
MKVGDGTSSFADLKWMSAKASDVYDWAKAATVVFDTTDYKIKFKDAKGAVIAKATIDLSTIDSRLTALEAKDITVTPSDTAKPGVVQSVTKGDDHEIDVTYGLVQTGDIADSAVAEAKIAANAVTTTKIKDANVTAAKLATDAVETAKIKNGAVTNDKLATGLSTDKFTIDSKTLTVKIGEMDADILTAKNHANAPHDYLPSNTNYAGSASKGGPANSVAHKLSIKLNGGTATEFDGSAAKAIDITPAAIGAATQEAVFGTGGLSDTVEQNAADILKNAGLIEDLQEAIANGVDFIGVTTTNVSTGTANTTATVKINNADKTAVKGDIVIYGTREFIWDGSKWEELGDATRVGNLETKVNNLKTTVTNAVATTHKFVSEVTQSEGQINVTYTQPNSADVTHAGSTVKTALENLDANKVDKSVYDAHSHTITAGATDDDVVVLTGTAGTNGVSYDAKHAKKAAGKAGTYRSVTIDEYGHVTGGTNPTTRDGYGLTDVYTKTEADAQFMTDAEVDSVVTPIKNNYVRYTQVGTTGKYQMHLGTGAEVIIFDCGGADND